MNHPVRYLPQALDFTPRIFPFGENFRFRATRTIIFQTGHSRLLMQGGQLVFYNGGQGLLEITAQAPESWRHLPRPWAGYGPGYDSRPVLIDPEGVVYRWQPEADPQPVFATAAPGLSVAAVGLPQNRLLLQIDEKNAWTSQVVETDSGKVLWSGSEALPMVLPYADLLLARPFLTDSSVHCLEAKTGRTRWKYASGAKLGDILGVCDDHVWLNTQDGRLLSLRVKDGQKQSEITLRNNRNPQGVMDPEGFLHICNGLNYQVVDLRQGSAKLVSYAEFEHTPDAPTTARGLLSLLLSQARLLFLDDLGKVFLVRPEDPSHPQCLWKRSKVFNLGIAEGQLILLDWEGRITVLGETKG